MHHLFREAASSTYFQPNSHPVLISVTGKPGECTLLLARALTVSIPNPSTPLSRPESTVPYSSINGSEDPACDPDPRRHLDDLQPSSQQQPGLCGSTDTPAMQPQQQRQNSTSVPVLCIELIGDRFLRKMVRVLVATAVREASAQRGLVATTDSSRNSSSTNSNGSAAHDSLGTSSGTVTATPEGSKIQTALFPGSVSLPASLGNGSIMSFADSEPVSAVMDPDSPSAVMDSDPSSALRRFCGGLEMRLLTAPAAPALGLCFAGVGYDDADDVVLPRSAGG